MARSLGLSLNDDGVAKRQVRGWIERQVNGRTGQVDDGTRAACIPDGLLGLDQVWPLKRAAQDDGGMPLISLYMIIYRHA